MQQGFCVCAPRCIICISSDESYVRRYVVQFARVKEEENILIYLHKLLAARDAVAFRSRPRGSFTSLACCMRLVVNWWRWV